MSGNILNDIVDALIEPPTLGPLVPFNAEASAAHRRWHEQMAPLKAKKRDIVMRLKALQNEGRALQQQIDVVDDAHVKALYRAHPELKESGFTVDCDKDGFQLHLRPDAPKPEAKSEPPVQHEWVGEIKRKLESEGGDGL